MRTLQLSSFAETLVALALLVGLNVFFFPDHPAYLSIHPHPFFAVVILVSVRYGRFEKGRWVIEDINTRALNGDRHYSGPYSRLAVDKDGTVRVFRMLTGESDYAAEVPLSLYMGWRRAK